MRSICGRIPESINIANTLIHRFSLITAFPCLLPGCGESRAQNMQGNTTPQTELSQAQTEEAEVDLQMAAA